MFVSALCLSAQDLGSSNTLFGTTRKPESTSAVKRSKPVAKKAKPKAVAAHATRKARPATASAKAPVRIAPRTQEKAAPATAKAVVSPNSETNEKYIRFIAEGNAARQASDAADAESAYKRATSLRPNDPVAFGLLGGLYFDTMRWELAEKVYRWALALEPDNAAYTLALSRVLSQPVAAANLSERYDEAEQLARKSLALRPGAANSSDQLGATLERRGLLGNGTESAYRTAIQRDSGNALAHAHLGRLMRKRGKLDAARSETAAAVATAADSATLTQVAESFQSEQRYADSIPLLRKALAVEPRNYTALVFLGRAQAAGGDLTGAESNLIVATRVSPFSFIGFSELGRLYMRQAKLEMAETVLMHATRLADAFERRELAAQFEHLGDAYDRSGKSKAAVNAYRTSLSLDGTRTTLAAKIAGIKR